MNPLPSIQTAPTQSCRASSLRTQPMTHDLAQDPNYPLIFRSLSSREGVSQLTVPQHLVRKHKQNSKVSHQQSSLSEVLTKQLAYLKQALKQQHLSFAQKDNLHETKNTYQALLNAPNIEREIQKWMGSFPDNVHQTLCLETWKGYKETEQNVSAFSAFLQKIRHAFYFDLFHIRLSFTKGVYNSKKHVFAQHRLLPVLLIIQNNPIIAKRLFCMAEDGLGACHDRPALTFIDIELETKCFLVLQQLKNLNPLSSDTHHLRQKLIHLEAQKYKKQYTISLLMEAFRDATYGDLDPLQTVLMNYGRIAKETAEFPVLPYLTCEGFVPEAEQSERKERVMNHLGSISRENWQTRLEVHLPTTDNWFEVLSMTFPDLENALRTLQDTRVEKSEQLIDANTALDQTYALQLESINDDYEKQKAELFNNPDVKAFTQQEVSNYLNTHHSRFRPILV